MSGHSEPAQRTVQFSKDSSEESDHFSEEEPKTPVYEQRLTYPVVAELHFDETVYDTSTFLNALRASSETVNVRGILCAVFIFGILMSAAVLLLSYGVGELALWLLEAPDYAADSKLLVGLWVVPILLILLGVLGISIVFLQICCCGVGMFSRHKN